LKKVICKEPQSDPQPNSLHNIKYDEVRRQGADLGGAREGLEVTDLLRVVRVAHHGPDLEALGEERLDNVRAYVAIRACHGDGRTRREAQRHFVLEMTTKKSDNGEHRQNECSMIAKSSMRLSAIAISPAQTLVLQLLKML